MQLRMCREK
ncbi:UNVERIFIED_CONTAM: hypothetical protein GTU68_060770 [Idotea baltica]|nr:hypothetical protein [Idotea baltica]